MNRCLLRTLGLLILGLTSCNGIQSPSPDEIVRQMQGTLSSAGGRHLLLDVTPDAAVWPDTLTMEVWEKGTDHRRIEVLQATEVPWAGMVMTINGTEAWLYDPNRQELTTGTPDTVRLPVVQDVVFSAQELILTADAGRAKLLGSEQLNGSQTYKLGLTLPDGGQATIWVDSQTWAARKVAFHSEFFGYGTVDVLTSEVNVDIPDSFFEPDVPEGTRLVDLNVVETPSPSPSISLEEVQLQATFPLLVPKYLPPGTTLSHATLVSGTVVLSYGPTPNSFTLVQGPSVGPMPALDTARTVILRGRQGTIIIEEGQGLFLTWEENGVNVSVAGPLPEAEALHIAEALHY
ncbi:MAG: hypothetical protein SVX38_02655 [Chloroflexota bacterium]|nr:hypothetical protein [Chloroflexota bacterium]